jgi:hypothetical protein
MPSEADSAGPAATPSAAPCATCMMPHLLASNHNLTNAAVFCAVCACSSTHCLQRCQQRDRYTTCIEHLAPLAAHFAQLCQPCHNRNVNPMHLHML